MAVRGLVWKASAAAAAITVGLAVMTAGAPRANAATPVPVGKLLMQDTFSGPLNRTLWVPFLTDGNTPGGAPWNYVSGQPRLSSSIGKPGDFYLDYDLPSLVRTGVPGIGLAMMAEKGSTAGGYTWSGSVICSYPDAPYGTKGFTFDNAYVEVRAKMPSGLADGGWPAIWFMSAPGSSGGEIDLVEGGYTKGSANPAQIMAINVHQTGADQMLYDAGVDLSKGYHTYGLAYKSGGYVKCYLDGKLVYQWDRENNTPTGSLYIIMGDNMTAATATGWHTVADESTPSPNEMDVKYVKAWELK
jgi:hypothetical protein